MIFSNIFPLIFRYRTNIDRFPVHCLWYFYCRDFFHQPFLGWQDRGRSMVWRGDRLHRNHWNQVFKETNRYWSKKMHSTPQSYCLYCTLCFCRVFLWWKNTVNIYNNIFFIFSVHILCNSYLFLQLLFSNFLISNYCLKTLCLFFPDTTRGVVAITVRTNRRQLLFTGVWASSLLLSSSYLLSFWSCVAKEVVPGLQKNPDRKQVRPHELCPSSIILFKVLIKKW